MDQLTSRELMFLEDHLKMEQTLAKSLKHFANECSDQQLQSMCQQMAQEHQNFSQMLTKHLNQQGKLQ